MSSDNEKNPKAVTGEEKSNSPEKPSSPPVDDDGADDDVQLSAFTMSALQEFVSEQLEREQRRQQVQEMAGAAAEGDPDELVDFTEDWQLSQFWYDDVTCDVLGGEALRLAGPTGRVACLSSPTLYRHLRKVRPEGLRLTLLEYDKRFSVFAPDFVLYDYRSPLDLPPELREQFDLVVADPPFLSEECLTKTAITVRLLAKQHIILCTGAQMGALAGRLLDVRECRFRPGHTNNLANEFRCFANYDLDSHVSPAGR